jgi:hypothetical protein
LAVIVEVIEIHRNGSSQALGVLTGGQGTRGPLELRRGGDDEMVLALIGSVGFLLVMSVGWSWLEARHERRGAGES